MNAILLITKIQYGNTLLSCREVGLVRVRIKEDSMEFKDLYQAYLAVGAGGLSLIILIWLLVYLVTKVNPSLQSIKESGLIHSKILENSTEAVKQVSVSIDNVASTLVILNHSFNTLISLFDKHDSKQDELYRMVLEMQSDLESITKLVLHEEQSRMRNEDKQSRE